MVQSSTLGRIRKEWRVNKLITRIMTSTSYDKPIIVNNGQIERSDDTVDMFVIYRHVSM